MTPFKTNISRTIKSAFSHRSKLPAATLLLGFLFSISTFAQGPDPDSTGGANPTDAPIGQQLIWLIIMAMVFAFVTFKKKVKTE